MVPTGGLAHGGSAEAGMGAEPPGGPHGGDSSGETSCRWMAWGMFFEGGLHQTCWRGRLLLEVSSSPVHKAPLLGRGGSHHGRSSPREPRSSAEVWALQHEDWEEFGGSSPGVSWGRETLTGWGALGSRADVGDEGSFSGSVLRGWL